MTTLYLIRHGQASFGANDYDRLSELGKRQSQLMGSHLRRTQPPLHALYVGRLRRHAETADHARLAPEGVAAKAMQAFDEYDYMSIIRAYLPAFMSRVGEERGLTQEDILRHPKLFELAFRFMVRAWMNNTPHEHGEFETWNAFCQRVAKGLRHLVDNHPPNARIAVFTSGGVIAAAMRQVLGLSNKRTLSVNWTIYNASVTQLYYGRGRRHGDALVIGFNSVTHLEMAGEKDLITFR
jgi:broad specificity phosphatase PhoE